MASLPENVRAYVVSALKAAATVAGDNVFDNKATPFWAEGLPAVNVVFAEEGIDENGPQSGPLRAMVGQLQVWAICKTESDDIDTLNRQIRAALNADRSLGGLVPNCAYQGWRQIVNEKATPPFLAHILSYELKYMDSLI